MATGSIPSRRWCWVVARRLGAERVAMVLATRDMRPLMPSGPLPELVIGGLSDPEARDLLTSVTKGTASPKTKQNSKPSTRRKGPADERDEYRRSEPS